MRFEARSQSFLDGYAIGELTGRLKHESPPQIEHFVPLAKLKDYRGALQKYRYHITHIAAHPADADQVRIVASKTAEGSDPNLVQAFARDDDFMDGWHTGCLASQLRYGRPDRLQEWVKLENLESVRAVVMQQGYTIAALHGHPQHTQWIQIVAVQPPQ